MNLEELKSSFGRVKNSYACGLMIETLKRKMVDRRRAFDLLNEREDTSWDLSTDLWLEIDKLEELLTKAEGKKKKLISEGF